MDRPEHGVRLVARLENSSGGGVSYQLEVSARAGSFSGRALIAEDGSVRLVEFERELAAPVSDFVVAQLRSVWRSSQGSGRWPRRLSRWRGVD